MKRGAFVGKDNKNSGSSFMDMITNSVKAKPKKVMLSTPPKQEAELYDDSELEIIENHIQKNFGDYKNVLHEILSPDIHCDICVIEPTEEHNFYTLITLGMGAHRMNIPDEYKKYNIYRAELAICLPPDWNIDSSDEKDYWPIRLLKVLARFPKRQDTWLGFGHSIDNIDPYADNTKFSCAILSQIVIGSKDAKFCTLPNGEDVNFYQVIPIYEEEKQFKVDNSANELFDYFDEDTFIVNPTRDSYITPKVALNHKLRKNTIDAFGYHAYKVDEKELSVEEICALNHIAIFLRWAIKNDLVNAEFKKKHPELLPEKIDKGDYPDIRKVLLDSYDGRLFTFILTEEGRRFCHYYYGTGEAPNYRSDVDMHAASYFGLARYFSRDFKDEAYLFVPYDERYYSEMAERIDEVYAYFQENIEGYQTSGNRENYFDYPFTIEIIDILSGFGISKVNDLEEKSPAELEPIFASLKPIQEENNLSDITLAMIIQDVIPMDN